MRPGASARAMLSNNDELPPQQLRNRLCSKNCRIFTGRPTIGRITPEATNKLPRDPRNGGAAVNDVACPKLVNSLLTNCSLSALRAPAAASGAASFRRKHETRPAVWSAKLLERRTCRGSTTYDATTSLTESPAFGRDIACRVIQRSLGAGKQEPHA